MIRRFFLAALCVAVSALPAAAAPGGEKDLVQVARKAGSFETLLKAVKAADLTKTLRMGGPYTIFAPTDEAFAKLPAGTVESLLRDPAALRSILLYHVVDGTVPASQVVGLSSATTLNGAPVSIAVVGGEVLLNGNTKVTATDVAASNGIIHVIDTVLLPPSN
jgi:uncharacterized surface protein with fasciclin (FAS1) repeats